MKQDIDTILDSMVRVYSKHCRPFVIQNKDTNEISIGYKWETESFERLFVDLAELYAREQIKAKTNRYLEFGDIR